jgi:plastocyanin
MRRLLAALLLALPPAAGWAQRSAPPPAPHGLSVGPQTITIRLSSFAFEPDHLRLRAGVPVRLRLVNESDGGHDFSAPAFFAASAYFAGSAPPPEGTIDVAGKSAAEISVVPQRPGTYRVECTHFLHSLFGMTATIDVVGASP